MSADAVAARLRAQGLGRERARDAHGAVRQALAIQAQDTRSSRLGVRARSEGLTVGDVVRACSEERSVVRTWAMRGTLHMLCAEDVRWITSLVGPHVERMHARRRAGLGLPPDLCERILAAIPGVLADRGPLTRAELMDALIARGLQIDTSDQAPAHLVLLAAVRGVACRGPDRPDEEPTYVRLDDWVPPEPVPGRDAALAELSRRFARAYGPADARDLAYWSGLPAAEARRALALAPPPDPPAGDGPLPVRLLPAFDGYLLGHRDRTPILPPRHAAKLLSGSWMLPSVVVDGRVAGTWRRTRERDGITVTITPFTARLPRGSVRALRAEAADVGRFLGAPARMEVAGGP